jgi:hypothetical protein
MIEVTCHNCNRSVQIKPALVAVVQTADGPERRPVNAGHSRQLGSVLTCACGERL